MIFSVVIPSYNREQVVLRAISSVLNQTFQDFEIVVVDDGSKDNTRQVVESINDPRVRYIWQKNQGATVARNTGIQNARGKYVSFLDSDDEWFNTMLEKQFETYQSDPYIGCVYSDVHIINAKGKVSSFSKPLGICDNSYKLILLQGYMAPTSVLSAKRDVLVKVGMFDTELPASQDDDICFKLAKNSKVGFIPEVLANMYVGQQNRISINKDRVARGWWMLRNKYEEDIVSHCGRDTMRDYYKDCVKRFALSGNSELCRKAIQKYHQYGGNDRWINNKLIEIGFIKKGVILQKMYGKLLKLLWK